MTALVKYEEKELRFTEEQVKIIKNSLCPGASDDEYKVYIAMCQERNLNPLKKQVYGMVSNKKITTMVSIEGYRAIANRSGQYMPGKETTFAYDKDGNLFSATAYVKRYSPQMGDYVEFGYTALLKEFVKPNQNWKDRPHVMLSIRAEANAIRRGFSEETSGLMTKDEMDYEEEELKTIVIEKEKTTEMVAKPEPAKIEGVFLGPSQMAIVEGIFAQHPDLRERVEKSLSKAGNSMDHVPASWMKILCDEAQRRAVAIEEEKIVRDQ